MGIITKPKTWADNENVTYTDINSNFDNVYNEVNGNLDNTNIDASANIEASKLDATVMETDTNQTVTGVKTLTTPIIAGSAGANPTTAGQLQFDSTSKYLKYGNGTTTYTVGQLNRAFSWYLDGTSIVADEVGAKYISPQAMTVVRISAKTASGTATIRVQRGTTDIANSIAVTSTIGHTTSFASSAITAYEIITLDITAVSSCVGLIVTVECSQP
jgi:hypothetical protein